MRTRWTGRPSGRPPTTTPELLAKLPGVRLVGGWVLLKTWPTVAAAYKARDRLRREPGAAGFEFRAAGGEGLGSGLLARAT